MKKIILLSLFGFLSLTQTNKIFGQIIDGIVLIPFSTQLVSSKINDKVFSENKKSAGGSFYPQILLQKELKPAISIFTGIGYAYNTESVLISKNVKIFSELTDLNWSNYQGDDCILQVKKLKYLDEYLTIPIGIRFYSRPKDERKFKMTFSTKLEASFLLNSKVDVSIVKKDIVIGVFGPSDNDQRISNTTYEKDAEQYFDSQTKKPLLNVQFGLGYEWRGGSQFSLGTELIFNAFFMEHKPDLLSRKTMFGAHIRLGYDFE